MGNIPLEWYREYPHIGYDIEGNRLLKPEKGDQLDEFLNKMDNPNYWSESVSLVMNKKLLTRLLNYPFIIIMAL